MGPIRVIVHSGFHKTGTTSFQDFLSNNRDRLAPHFNYYGKADFLLAGAHGRRYGQFRTPYRLWRFRRSIRRFLQTIPNDHSVILSRETFSGNMPGHRTVTGRVVKNYTDAAKPLASVLISEIKRRFGADVDISFFFTVREKEAWLKSVHGHLLRSIKMTDDLEAFRTSLTGVEDPIKAAEVMRQYLAPVKADVAALEDYATHPYGPAAAVLDLFDIPASLLQGLEPA